MNHEELARHNMSLADSEGDNPWKITKYFYAAVHAIDFVMHPGSQAPDEKYDHWEREQKMKRLNLTELYGLHMELKKMSLTARYRPWYHPMGDDRVKRAKYLATAIMSRAGVSMPVSPPASTIETALPDSSSPQSGAALQSG